MYCNLLSKYYVFCIQCLRRLCAPGKIENKHNMKLATHECTRGRPTMYFCRVCKVFHKFGLEHQCQMASYNGSTIFPKIMLLTSAIVSNTARFECTVCLDADGLFCDLHASLQVDENQSSYANMILVLREKVSFIP